jgi:hypothetical protein
MKTKYRRQKPISGGRKFIGSGMINDIEREIMKLVYRYKVSRSFVIAATLADAFGIDEQERFKK